MMCDFTDERLGGRMPACTFLSTQETIEAGNDFYSAFSTVEYYIDRAPNRPHPEWIGTM